MMSVVSSVVPLLSKIIMKLSICTAVAVLLLSPAIALAQNGNLPAVQNSYMSGSSSRSAAMQEQQKMQQRMKLQQMQAGARQGAGAGRANLGQTYGQPQPQQQIQQQQAAAGMPVQSMINNGLPQVRTSRYCGMPGEDMVKNNVRSAAIQARNPKPVVRAQPKPQVPQGPTYSYSGGYDYKSSPGDQGGQQ